MYVTLTRTCTRIHTHRGVRSESISHFLSLCSADQSPRASHTHTHTRSAVSKLWFAALRLKQSRMYISEPVLALTPPPLRRSPAGGPVLQSLLQRRPLVLWPCRCRRGGAYSLINTPVTRVKPPQARAAPATPRQRGQERGRRSGLARRPDSPKLPAKPSIFREKSGSGAGGLREAPRTLRASVRVFTAETSRAASVPAEPPAGSAGPQTEDPPLRCGPKEQKWPREERDEPRSCRRTDRRACAFPTPPALAARASPGGVGGAGA